MAFKDVVVLIPGIGGSELSKDGDAIWSVTAGSFLRGVLSRGGSIKRLALDGDDPDAEDLGDGVVATGLMRDFHVVPGLDWGIDGYGDAARLLVERLELDPGQNFFELPYDWRRDNRVAARLLARRAAGWLRERREQGHADAKLVLVGHSMGGIVARLFLESAYDELDALGEGAEGWRYTRRLVTLGTPYSGSVNAAEFLVNGFKKGWGPFTIDLSDTIRSFTSVYQLLPSYRCLSGDAGAWLNLDEVDWSGSGVDQQRLVDALTLHRDLRARIDDRLATGVPGYDVRPVVGDFQRTRWALHRSGTGAASTVRAAFARAAGEDGGDGTVPKVSASPHEFLPDFTNAMFPSQRHASLQNDGAVSDHVVGVIRTAIDTTVPVFPAADSRVSLDVESVTTDEPLVVRALNAAGLPLTGSLTPRSGGDPVPLALTPAGDGWLEARLEGLPEDDYEVTVRGPGSHPVTDVVAVVDLSTIG